ncbi:MAG TPA: acetyl-CoA carboxylase biotin carboxyl carrier protein subunit [Chitinophagaceae bacterium]
MYKATVNRQHSFEIGIDGAAVTVNGENIAWSAGEGADGAYSVLCDHKSYRAEVLKTDQENKSIRIRMNGQEYEVVIEEPVDRLLKKMGIKAGAVHKVNEIRASMPGLVLKVLVVAGQSLKKGDPVLILEAMKMENVLKAASDAVVRSVKAVEKTAVEKGQVLIVLE